MYADLETLWLTTIDRNPASWMANDNLGLLLLENGHLNKSIIRFQASLAIQPDNAEAHNNLGNALLQERRLDEAIVHYQTALAIQPGLRQSLQRSGHGSPSKRAVGRGDCPIPEGAGHLA